ncbi:MAG TPA: nucleoside monophosphate kinase [Candidatus Paceibacterota bacterium]|nr:nucleoside monophosphate kinase [Candidatus Paceibacterota bacterium]
MNTSHTIFFVGKPGCGKGTQSKLLAEHTGWPIFASGKLFRDIAKEDTPVGHKTKEYDEKGLLQPHWFAMYLYLKSLFSIPNDQSAIFDGFNRKIQEAELVISSLGWLGRKFSIVNLQVSDEDVHTRLASRKETSGRADDHMVDERLREFYAHTEPAIEVFRNAGALIDVDGGSSRTEAEIASSIRKALGIA